MIKKVDHITFAVKDMAEVGRRLVEVYDAKPVMRVENEEMKYKSDAYIVGGDLIIGFLEATEPDSFVAQHIDRHGESLQHIGIDVENLDDAKKRFDDHGIKYSAYKEIDGVRREVLVGKRGAFGAVLQVMEWLGEFKDASSAERMRKAWDVE
jgi:methylmalonyl-CoA/ethylmalonyl-CoA epimerase